MKLFITLIGLIATAHALSDEIVWKEFKTNHSRQYSLIEDELRFKVFQTNLRKIEEHNLKYQNGEVSYFFTTTQFADWTFDEFQEILSPVVPVILKSDLMVETITTYGDDAPTSLDWRKKGAVTAVKNQVQSKCASGWAFSATGALEGQLAIEKNQSISLSEQELIDCSSAFGNNGCSAGQASDALNYVGDMGLSSTKQYPYRSKKNVCRRDLVIDPPLDHIHTLVFIKGMEPLVAYSTAYAGPLSATVEVNSNWQLYGGGIFDDDTCGQKVNHGILIVGYDTEEKDYWILKNSWGRRWGEKGYIRLVRGKQQCGINFNTLYPVL